MTSSGRRTAGGVVIALAVLAALLSAASGARAQPPQCFGRDATIVARAGQVTFGTNGNDVIVGTPGADDIRALAGNDRICSRGGPDRVDGGPGRDRIDTGGGADTATGGAGRDRMFGRNGPDDLRGGLGPDVLGGGTGNDSLQGQAGTDRCNGGAGRNRVRTCDEASLTESFFLPPQCLFDAGIWTNGEPPAHEVPFLAGGVRQAYRIDIDGDGRPGRIRATYCNFGGNALNHSIHVHNDEGRYLGVISVWRDARPVGEGGAIPTILGVDGHEVDIRALGYAPGDSTCCPSLTTTLRYRWTTQALQLVEFDGARGVRGSATDVRNRFVQSWNRGDMRDLRRFASPQAIAVVRELRPDGKRLSAGLGTCGNLCLAFPEEPFQFFAIYFTTMELDTGRVVITDARWESTN